MSESLKSKMLSKSSERVARVLKDEIMFSSPETVQFANELIEFISEKEGLTYQEVYQALELTYLVVESQSIYAAINPINLQSVPLKKTNGYEEPL